MAKLEDRNNILNIIVHNALITDVSDLQQQLSQLVPGPIHMEHQQEKMMPHWDFLEQLVQGNEVLRSKCWYARFRMDRMKNAASEASNIPLVDFLSDLFVEADLWSQWIAHLDQVATQSLQANMEAMDRAAQAGQELRKRIVIIGGGPLSAVLACVLAPYYRVTLVTMERRVADQWRTRDMWLNSTCTITDPDGAPLPLKEGPTTRTLPRMFKGIRMGLDVDVLARREALTITCELGTATYPWGPLFGELIAHNLLMNVEDVLTHQWVDVSKSTEMPDGTMRLTLVDIDSLQERTLDACTVFALTGPGPEATKVSDAETEGEYQGASDLVDRLLRLARTQLAFQREQLQIDLQRLTIPALQEERKEIFLQYATQVADFLQRRLPLIWTLTSIQKVRSFWRELEEAGVSADAYPLLPLLDRNNAVAYVGNGNTQQTLKSFIDGNVSPLAYPEGVRPRGSQRAVIYNVQATTAEEYQFGTRRRYWDVFSANTRTIPYKAASYCIVYDEFRGCNRVEVMHIDADGETIFRRYDFLVDATGLDRSALEDKLPSDLEMQTIFDQDGVAVARGNRAQTFFIAGSATGKKAPDFDAAIRRIFEALGISDNTIAQWALGPAVERLAYFFILSQRQA